MAWTEKNVETLKKLWKEGINTKIIAKEIGGKVTSNSVVGKARRLGLGEHPNYKPFRKKADRPSRFPDRQTGRAKKASTNKKCERIKRTQAETTDITRALSVRTGSIMPISRRLKLVQLNDDVCRWPHGEPWAEDFSFCGNPAKGGYCEYHRKLAHQPAETRRRR